MVAFLRMSPMSYHEEEQTSSRRAICRNDTLGKREGPNKTRVTHAMRQIPRENTISNKRTSKYPYQWHQ